MQKNSETKRQQKSWFLSRIYLKEMENKNNKTIFLLILALS